MKYKIFEGNVQSALENCLKEKYISATIEEIYQLKKENSEIQEIWKEKWFDSRNAFNIKTGEIRVFTLKELKNIEEMYNNDWRLIFVGYGDCSNGLSAGSHLVDDGRFLGIKDK